MWQTPHATSRTSTSPAFGSASSTVLDLERGAELAEDCGLNAHRRIIVEPMARIRPFTALRYDVPDLAAVVAPPYDVISDELRAELGARSPYNVVHLTLPDSRGAGRARSRGVARGGRARRGRRAVVLVARAGLRRPGRRRADARGLRRRAARRAVRPAHRAAARAHACRPEGRAAAPASRDAHAARADLPALGRLDRDRRPRRARPRGRGERHRVAALAARRRVR